MIGDFQQPTKSQKVVVEKVLVSDDMYLSLKSTSWVGEQETTRRVIEFGGPDFLVQGTRYRLTLTKTRTKFYTLE